MFQIAAGRSLLNAGQCVAFLYHFWTMASKAEWNLTLSTGTVVPALVLGTWKMKGEAINTAIHVGYRRFDVSGFHGNQAEIGAALQKVFQEGVVKREDLFFTEKLGSAHHDPEDVEVDVKDNLKDLQLGYLDCLQVHPFTAISALSSDDVPTYDPERFAKTWQAMEALVAKGLVRSIGVTNFSIRKLENLLKTAKIIPAVNQIEFHPYLQQPKLRKYCQSKGIAVEAYSPLGSPGWFKKKGQQVVLEDPVIQQIATKHNATTAQICIAYALHLGLAVVPKSSNKQHLTENFKAQELQLDSEDIDQLRALDKNMKLFKFESYLRPGQTLESLWDVVEDEAFMLD